MYPARLKGITPHVRLRIIVGWWLTSKRLINNGEVELNRNAANEQRRTLELRLGKPVGYRCRNFGNGCEHVGVLANFNANEDS